MRGFSLLVAVVAALVVPIAAPAGVWEKPLPKKVPGTGSLVVQNGSGFVSVAGRGGVIGRFDQGQIRIELKNDDVDAKPPIVFGAERVRPIDAHTTVYIGNDVHFYIGGHFRVRVDAIGIDLSAVGRGSALIGSGFVTPGQYKLDDGPFLAIPDTPLRLALGTPPPTP